MSLMLKRLKELLNLDTLVWSWLQILVLRKHVKLRNDEKPINTTWQIVDKLEAVFLWMQPGFALEWVDWAYKHQA